MNGPPTASWVITAFNEEPRIERALRSILSQSSGEPFEIIVIDDGSTDMTAEVADSILSAASHDPRMVRFKVIQNKKIWGVR